MLQKAKKEAATMAAAEAKRLEAASFSRSVSFLERVRALRGCTFLLLPKVFSSLVLSTFSVFCVYFSKDASCSTEMD